MAPFEAPGRSPWLFSALLLSSGFCGISYEVLYGRMLGNLVGDPFAITGAVLLTFLLGIGLGTRFAHRLWRHLWLIEAGIGAYGVAFALLGGPLERVLYAAGGGPLRLVLLCAGVLCAPAFLIGCSVPLFAGYASRLARGPTFSRVYTLYNLGAAVTGLFIEFTLLRALGIQRTVFAIAALNLAVALTLRFRFSALRATPPAPGALEKTPVRPALALAAVSVGSAVFQLTMVKVAECLVGPFRETFAVVLSLVLGGIALGSWAVARWRLSFERVLELNLFGLIWVLGALEPVAQLYAALSPQAMQTHAGALALKLATFGLLFGLPCATFGATVPALLRGQGPVATESGRLLFVSSLANALGFGLMVVALHRLLDYGQILAVVCLLTAVAQTVHLGIKGRALAAVGLALLGQGASTTLWREDLLFLGHTSFKSSKDLRAAREGWEHAQTFKGSQDSFSITWSKGRPHFFINGFVSIALDSPSEKLVGAFASLFAPRLDRALVLGLGSGATGGAMALLFDQLDAVEINPVVIDNLQRLSPYNFDITSRPGVKVVHDDAIHFTRAADDRYSLVVNTVTTPLYFSSAKLYTRDFLASVKGRLTPDGVYMTWFDSRVGDAGADIILRTLASTFGHCALGAIRSTYFLLLCSDQPLHIPDPERISKEPTLAAYFAAEDVRADLIPYQLLSTDALALAGDRAAPINTLDRPALEFEIARLSGRGLDGFKARLRRSLDPSALAEVSGDPARWKPSEAAEHLSELLEGSSLLKAYRAKVR